MTNDTPFVGGARSAPVGTREWLHNLGRHQHVVDESSRELVGRHHGVRAADEVPIGDELAARIESGLEVVRARRPVLVVRHVVFARPQQLDRDGRQSRRGPLVGDELGDAGDLDVVLAHKPASKSAAGLDEVHRDVLRRQTRTERRMLKARDLARRPDLEASVLIERRGVLRLERRVRQEREVVLGFDDLRRGLERGLDVADGRAALCGGRRRRGRHPRRHVLALLEVARRAFDRGRTLVPHDFQRAPRVVGQPPTVGDDSDAGVQRVVALARGLDDERVLHARQAA